MRKPVNLGEYFERTTERRCVVIDSELVPNPHCLGRHFELLAVAVLDDDGRPVKVERVPAGRFGVQWKPSGRMVRRVGRVYEVVRERREYAA